MAEPLPIARNAATECRPLPQMVNRHGLVTGATGTGTGKTVTLQALAEGLSKIGDAGVPVGREGHRSGSWARMRAHMPWCHHASPRLRRHFRGRRDWAAPRQCLMNQGLGPFEAVFQVNASPCYPALVRPISLDWAHILTPEQIIAEIERYEAELARILAAFRNTSSGLYMAQGDDPLYRQYGRELVDLYNDALGSNVYSKQLAAEYSNGFGMYDSPSFKGVENVLAVVRASLTRLRRSPELLSKRGAEEALRHRENVFIIHGRDEAKWRELKDIVRSEFRLTPIVLMEQPDAGCKTVIEKFEHYAQTCTYAIAIFTPDDEVHSGDAGYLQARPNVIYELGWFCGKLGRGGAMLLLKEGTDLFSDFGGIMQKRFKQNVSERVIEIRRDLEAAGVLAPV